jgi:hypothetical protein
MNSTAQEKSLVETWQRAGLALDQIKTQELKSLTDATAAAQFAVVMQGTAPVWYSDETLNSVGFVQQQAYFKKGHVRQSHR